MQLLISRGIKRLKWIKKALVAFAIFKFLEHFSSQGAIRHKELQSELSAASNLTAQPVNRSRSFIEFELALSN